MGINVDFHVQPDQRLDVQVHKFSTFYLVKLHSNGNGVDLYLHDRRILDELYTDLGAAITTPVIFTEE